MFDKISRAAEKAAAGVGRREFLGGLGRGAAALAAGVGGLLFTATRAQAGGSCTYECADGSFVTKGGRNCPGEIKHHGVHCLLIDWV